MKISLRHEGLAAGGEVALLLGLQGILIACEPGQLAIYIYMRVPMPPHGFFDLLAYAVSGDRDAHRAFSYVWLYATQFAVSFFAGLLVLGAFILLRAMLGWVPALIRRGGSRHAVMTRDSEVVAFALALALAFFATFAAGFLVPGDMTDYPLDYLDVASALLAVPVFFFLRRHFSIGDFDDDFRAVDRV